MDHEISFISISIDEDFQLSEGTESDNFGFQISLIESTTYEDSDPETLSEAEEEAEWEAEGTEVDLDQIVEQLSSRGSGD